MHANTLIASILLCLNLFEFYRCEFKFSLDKPKSELQYYQKLSWLTDMKNELNQNPICALTDMEKNQICSDLFKYGLDHVKFVKSEDMTCKKQPLILDAQQPSIYLEEEGFPCYYEVYDRTYPKWITQGDSKTIYMLSDIDSKFRILGYLENINIPSPSIQKKSLMSMTENSNLILEINRLQAELKALQAENAALQLQIIARDNAMRLQINAVNEINNTISDDINIVRFYYNSSSGNNHYLSMDPYETELKYLADSRWFSSERAECSRNSFCQLTNEVKSKICAKLFQLHRDFGEFRYKPTDTLNCEKRKLRLCSINKKSSECYIFNDCAIPCNGWINGELKTQWIVSIDQNTIMLLNSFKNEARVEGYITGITIP